VAVFLALGCGKAEAPAAESAGDKVQAEGEKGEKGDKDAAPADEAPVIDQELLSQLEGVISNCEVNVDGCSVTKCKNKEDREFTKQFTDGTKKRGAAVDTWAAALASDDPKMQTVAANVFGKVFRSMGKPEEKPEVSGAAAKRVIDAIAKLPRYPSAQSIEGATHLAMLGGQAEALYTMVGAHENAAVLQVMVWREAMQFGRLDVFPKLEEVAKGDDPKQVAAAMKSPRQMFGATQAEKAKVCPWAKGYLTAESTSVLAEAGQTMLWCKGTYIDALLDEGEARLSKHVFDRDMYLVFRDVCFSPLAGSDVSGAAEQCERTYSYLENVVKDGAIDGKSRGLALFAIYYQRRDAASLALAKSYLRDKDPDIKKKAEDIVESLEKRLAK